MACEQNRAVNSLIFKGNFVFSPFYSNKNKLGNLEMTIEIDGTYIHECKFKEVGK